MSPDEQIRHARRAAAAQRRLKEPAAAEAATLADPAVDAFARATAETIKRLDQRVAGLEDQG